MRFIMNLLPQLQRAASAPPHFSRTLSVLGAGYEARIDLNDLDLRKSFSPLKCANHTTVMNDFMAEELAVRNPNTSFIHSTPSIVLTPITRELPLYAKIFIKVLTPVLAFLAVSPAETGARQLFIATSAMYSPAKIQDGAPLSAGVPIPEGLGVAKGSNSEEGSGGYIVNWNGEPTGKQKILGEYRDLGISKKIYEHTMQIFQSVEQVNRDRGKGVTA